MLDTTRNAFNLICRLGFKISLGRMAMSPASRRVSWLTVNAAQFAMEISVSVTSDLSSLLRIAIKYWDS